jgi:hypothetical protein
MQNLLLKIPYKFKNSYGGPPEPQTTQDAPWLHGPSLKNSPAGSMIFFFKNARKKIIDPTGVRRSSNPTGEFLKLYVLQYSTKSTSGVELSSTCQSKNATHVKKPVFENPNLLREVLFV